MSFLEFYGDECPHCLIMQPLVQKLEKELNIVVEKFEVWKNEDNSKKQREYDVGLCGGVPFFFNTETKKYICGSVEYRDLKAWAEGK